MQRGAGEGHVPNAGMVRVCVQARRAARVPSETTGIGMRGPAEGRIRWLIH